MGRSRRGRPSSAVLVLVAAAAATTAAVGRAVTWTTSLRQVLRRLPGSRRQPPAAGVAYPTALPRSTQIWGATAGEGKEAKKATKVSFKDLTWHDGQPQSLLGQRPFVMASASVLESVRRATLSKEQMPGFPIEDTLQATHNLRTYLVTTAWHRLEQNNVRPGAPSHLKWFGHDGHVFAVLMNTNLPDREDPEDDLLMLLVPKNTSQAYGDHLDELVVRAVFPSRELVIGEKMLLHLSLALTKLFPEDLLKGLEPEVGEQCALVRDGDADLPIAVSDVPGEALTFDPHAKVHLLFNASHLRRLHRNVSEPALRQAFQRTLRDLRRSRNRVVPGYYRDQLVSNSTGKVVLFAPIWLEESPSTEAQMALVLTPRTNAHTGEKYYTSHTALPLDIAWRSSLILNPSLRSWLNPVC